MYQNQVDYDFAKAWDNSRGNFAGEFAKNVMNHINLNQIKVKTVIDICCGSSNLLRVFANNGLDCIGTETRQGMIEYSKFNNPNISYVLANEMYEIPTKQKAELITCTGDIVNYFESFDNWIEFFKNVNKKLSGNGVFIFDFYSKNKLKNWNETTYSSTNLLDCLMSVKSGLYDKTVINYTYYVNTEDCSIKTRDIVVESYFETSDIVEALKKCGFKNVTLTNEKLEPLTSPDIAERIYVVAKRK